MKLIKKIAIAILIIVLFLAMTCEPKDPYYETDNVPYMSDVVMIPDRVYAKGSCKRVKTKTLKRDYELIGEFVLTGYCGCAKCCGRAGAKTASGTTPKAKHTIATDTRVIPFGTEIVIDGIVYEAEDTGSAIKGYKIDVFFDSHSEALDFGVKRNVKVYKKKPPKLISALNTIKKGVIGFASGIRS